jgi:hypothetical protein
MKEAILFFGALLVASPPAQQSDKPAPKGVIYGTVVDQDERPAKRLFLVATCGKGPQPAMLPRTKTDQNGNDRFVSLPWLGRCTVYAGDEEAGYSIYSTAPADSGRPAEVTLSPQHPEGELNFRLPPKAGFLQIHLTNRRTGAALSKMAVKIRSQLNPDQPLFREVPRRNTRFSCHPTRTCCCT